MKKISILSIVVIVITLMSFTVFGCKPTAAVDTVSTTSSADVETSEESPSTENKLSKIGYNILVGSGAHWQMIIAEVQKLCDAENIELMVTDANLDAEKQVADIEDMVNAGCEVIIAVSVDPVAIEAAVEYAHSKGVYVISDISQFKNADAYVGFSEYDRGYVVGDFVGQWWAQNKADEIGYIIESNADDLGGDLPDRTDGMVEAFKKHVPGSEIVMNITCWQEECGFSLMEDTLVSQPDANLFFGSNNETTYGAVAALKAAGKTPGKDIIFACVDNQYKMVEMVLNDEVLVTDYINEPGEAKILIDVAKKLISESFDKGSNVFFDTQVINKDNSQEFLSLLEPYK